MPLGSLFATHCKPVIEQNSTVVSCKTQAQLGNLDLAGKSAAGIETLFVSLDLPITRVGI
jgi:hypothetical protein